MNGMVVTFLSAKGGIGTSSLCANIAMWLASEKTESRVAVMDLVLPIGSIASIVGSNDPFNLVMMSNQDPVQIRSTFLSTTLPRVENWNFHLLAGASDPEAASQLVVERVDEIVTVIRENYEYVLVDLGRTLSRISLPIIHKADVIVLIVGHDLASAAITKKVWEFLKKIGIDEKRMFLMFNRAVGLEGLIKNELEQMIGLPIRLTIPYMREDLTIANNRHEPIITKYPNTSPAISVKQAASEISNLGNRLRTV
jgi:pilus assembly protein CpaE